MPNPLVDALSRMAVSLQGAGPGFSGRLWRELQPWLAQLSQHAAGKWVPRLTFGFPCQIPNYQAGVPVGPCQHHAITTCDVCQKPCCLHHARIDSLGDGICYLCVAAAVRRARGEPEPTVDLGWARKQLRVKVDASWEEVRAAHRKLSAIHHPDKQRTDKAKAKAEAKFKDIQKAFDMLKTEHEKAA